MADQPRTGLLDNRPWCVSIRGPCIAAPDRPRLAGGFLPTCFAARKVPRVRRPLPDNRIGFQVVGLEWS
jgi:hypothetical protein